MDPDEIKFWIKMPDFVVVSSDDCEDDKWSWFTTLERLGVKSEKKIVRGGCPPVNQHKSSFQRRTQKMGELMQFLVLNWKDLSGLAAFLMYLHLSATTLNLTFWHSHEGKFFITLQAMTYTRILTSKSTYIVRIRFKFSYSKFLRVLHKQNTALLSHVSQSQA